MSDFVGVLPAAGRGLRLGAIPCSKEIMPLGFQLQQGQQAPYWRPVTTLDQHLHALKQAGATKVVIIINEMKDDLVRYVGNGERYGLAIAFVCIPADIQRQGMPGSINLATPWVGDSTTLFAMPDTLVTPNDTMAQLRQAHTERRADVTLGLFRTTTPHKFGMVEMNAAGIVMGFVDKPKQTELVWMWGLAAWSSYFTHLLRETIETTMPANPEIVLSDIFQAALDRGMNVQAVQFEWSQYRDIGTPQDFQAVVSLTAGHG